MGLAGSVRWSLGSLSLSCLQTNLERLISKYYMYITLGRVLHVPSLPEWPGRAASINS